MKGELINVSTKTIKSSIEKDTFLHANLFSRYFIVLSGPLANLILGLLLITSLYVFHGRYTTAPIINEIMTQSQPWKEVYYLVTKLLELTIMKYKDFLDIKNIVENNPNKKLSFVLLRNNNIISTTIIPTEFYDKKLDKVIGRIGITANSPELKTTIYFARY